MNHPQKLILSLVLRRRERPARAFSSGLNPRVHVPRKKEVKAGRTMPGLSTATPP